MRCVATFAVFLFLPVAYAEDVKIVLWNGEEMFDVPAVNARQSDLEEFANDLEPDILLLDEVCSLEAVERVRDIMGLSDYQVVCSDYAQNDNNQHGSFEVAVLSRFPISHCVEFDVTPDNRPHFRGGEPAERLLDPSPLFKLGSGGQSREGGSFGCELTS